MSKGLCGVSFFLFPPSREVRGMGKERGIHAGKFCVYKFWMYVYKF